MFKLDSEPRLRPKMAARRRPPAGHAAALSPSPTRSLHDARSCRPPTRGSPPPPRRRVLPLQHRHGPAPSEPAQGRPDSDAGPHLSGAHSVGAHWAHSVGGPGPSRRIWGGAVRCPALPLTRSRLSAVPPLLARWRVRSRRSAPRLAPPHPRAAPRRCHAQLKFGSAQSESRRVAPPSPPPAPPTSARLGDLRQSGRTLRAGMLARIGHIQAATTAVKLSSAGGMGGRP